MTSCATESPLATLGTRAAGVAPWSGAFWWSRKIVRCLVLLPLNAAYHRCHNVPGAITGISSPARPAVMATVTPRTARPPEPEMPVRLACPLFRILFVS